MLDPATVTFMERGRALIVGTVAADGAPRASRAWGLRVTDPEAGRARVLLADDDHRAHENLAAGRPVAVTCTDVVTLESIQFKGTSAGPVAPGTDDTALFEAYVEAFYGDIIATDGTPAAVLDRLSPAGVVPYEIVFDVAFDQTPGPAAGRQVRSGDREPTGADEAERP